MALISGTRLGPYEILAPIGAGGMGEVYKAKDTRLDRTVAIKVLPEHLAESPERKARFEREAKAISQLNHPHICTLYDVGEQDGIDFIVMEYIEGETLAERLKKGALPLDKALEYGIQISDGLDTAHRAGIVHRDLKPANAMLTKAGVKLLDFGLARLVEGDDDPETSEAPTRQKDLTKEESIIGTLQYMAPEQLERKPADARTDIFAFGAVLYEMVTGNKAFEGESHASLIAAILEHDPSPMSQLQPITPPLLERVVELCLAKDPDDRWQQAADIERQLEWIAGGETGDRATAAPRKNRDHLSWTVAAVATLVAIAAIFWPTTPDPSVQKFHVLPPDKPIFYRSAPAVSPDAKSLAMVATDASGDQLLWVRTFDSLEFRPLAGTEGATHPFWSPDSQSIGFFAQGKIKKVELDGRPPDTLCDNPRLERGGTWNREGVILFADSEAIFRVSASGGEATPVVSRYSDASAPVYPSFLPDGRHFLYVAGQPSQNSVEDFIFVGSLDSSKKIPLVQARTNAMYAPPGYLVYVREGTLLAQPFNADRLQLTGDPIRVTDGVSRGGVSSWLFSVSSNGMLSYSHFDYRPTWFDRSGAKGKPIGDPAFDCYHLSLSPDERQVAMTCFDPEMEISDIRLVDLSRNITSRFTFEPVWDQFAVWSPDGKSLAIVTNNELVERTVDGQVEPRTLLDGDLQGLPTDWSPDGDYVMFQTSQIGENSDLLLVPTRGSDEPTNYLATDFNEVEAKFSPDGKWIVYATDESGRFEVYVQSFPDGDQKQQISSDGGKKPHWRSDGEEIFYIARDGTLVAVSVRTSPNLAVGPSQGLFETDFQLPQTSYDVSADGERFLVFSLTESSVTVVLNWTALLER